MPIQVYPISSLSFDQSKQLDSPNGKKTPAVLLLHEEKYTALLNLLVKLWHCLFKLWKCQKAMAILPHESKALLQLFCLQPIIFGWRQNSFSGAFASWGKTKIHYFTWADQYRIGLTIFKNLRMWTGSDSILLDQDWTRTEKFHSPLISGRVH